MFWNCDHHKETRKKSHQTGVEPRGPSSGVREARPRLREGGLCVSGPLSVQGPVQLQALTSRDSNYPGQKGIFLWHIPHVPFIE